MNHKNSQIPKEHLSRINLNGLKGRVLTIPNNKTRRKIVLIYGHHSSLERVHSIASVLADYGTVSVPDLPGFGGMDPLYKIGLEADFDTIADYLAAYIKTSFKKERFTLAAFSIGFAITTRMLQKYPEIASQVDLLISVAGFSKRDDFKLSRKIQFTYRTLSKFFSGKYTSKVFRYTALNGLVIKIFYRYTPNARHKFKGVDKRTFINHINFETELWHNNDVRTYMKTSYAMLTSDLTGEKVDLAVRHISVGDNDQYFDNQKVIEHFNKIYTSCTVDHASLDSHMPSVIATKEEATSLIPYNTKKLLSKKIKQ